MPKHAKNTICLGYAGDAEAAARSLLSIFVVMTIVLLSPARASSLLAADAGSGPSNAGDGATTAPLDDAMRKKVEQKAGRMVAALKLDDAAKADKAKAIAGDWIAAML